MPFIKNKITTTQSKVNYIYFYQLLILLIIFYLFFIYILNKVNCTKFDGRAQISVQKKRPKCQFGKKKN